MELRRVDPRILKANAHNPRKIQPGEMSDAALKSHHQSRRRHPAPDRVRTRRRSHDRLWLPPRAFGHRARIYEIDVLVKDPDGRDKIGPADNARRA